MHGKITKKKNHVYVLFYDVSDINLMSSSVTESYPANSRWRRSDTSFFYYNSNHQKAAQSKHSIHSPHDHNTTALDTGRYCHPSRRPRTEAMLGNVTDHQAAETNKWIAMQRTTVGTTWTADYQENETGQLYQPQSSIPIKLYIKKCIWVALILQPCRSVKERRSL
jgi:hypothetical protein